MKSFILSIALVAITTFSFAQNARDITSQADDYISNDLRASISLDNNALVNVKVAKIRGDKVKIRVKENNKVLYQNSYRPYALVDIQYDISQFPAGKYTFEIIKNKEVVYSNIIDYPKTTDLMVQQ